MKKKLAITFIIFVTFSCSKLANYTYIPSGTYSTTDLFEKIVISDKNIKFYLKDKRLNPKRLSLTYKHKVFNKKIYISQLISNDYGYGVGIYGWKWDGKQIIQIEYIKGEKKHKEKYFKIKKE